MVNPKRVRDFAKGLGQLAKTDRIDAAMIARFGEAVQPRPRGKTPEKQAELRDLVTRRRQVVVMRTREQNRRGIQVAAQARSLLKKTSLTYSRTPASVRP